MPRKNSSLLIRGGTVVTAEKTLTADVYVEGETIAKIGSKLNRTADLTIDATGKLVIPGGIDPHTHFDMPYGDTVSSDDFETGTIAAACGGTTTVIDYAGQTKGRSLREGLDEWRRKAEGKAVIDYAFHMMVCDLPNERLPEMSALTLDGTRSFKFFTAYPGRLMLPDSVIEQAMRQSVKDGSVICLHCEDGPEIERRIVEALQKKQTAPKYHALTRPNSTEADAIRRMILLSEQTGATLYVVHLSSKEGLEEIHHARTRGLKVVTETCPQYLFLDRSLYDQDPGEAAKYVLSPPLRGKQDQEALWKGLADGDIQCVGTDHCPFLLKEKVEGSKIDFTKIPGGGPGVENRMSLLYQGVVDGRISVNLFIEITSTAAAKFFGLYPKKGTIAVGSDADLVIFDPNREKTMSAKNPQTHHMRVDYNLYEGMEVRGSPETVILRGRVGAREGGFVGKKGFGRLLRQGMGMALAGLFCLAGGRTTASTLEKSLEEVVAASETIVLATRAFPEKTAKNEERFLSRETLFNSDDLILPVEFRVQSPNQKLFDAIATDLKKGKPYPISILDTYGSSIRPEAFPKVKKMILFLKKGKAWDGYLYAMEQAYEAIDRKKEVIRMIDKVKRGKSEPKALTSEELTTKFAAALCSSEAIDRFQEVVDRKEKLKMSAESPEKEQAGIREGMKLIHSDLARVLKEQKVGTEGLRALAKKEDEETITKSVDGVITSLLESCQDRLKETVYFRENTVVRETLWEIVREFR
ncbi:MAG: dihydropyrimidinase [Pseudomonadota bacterium]